jgi:hypothetical protein
MVGALLAATAALLAPPAEAAPLENRWLAIVGTESTPQVGWVETTPYAGLRPHLFIRVDGTFAEEKAARARCAEHEQAGRKCYARFAGPRRPAGPPTLDEAKQLAEWASGGRVLFARRLEAGGSEAPLVVATHPAAGAGEGVCDEMTPGTWDSAAIVYLFRNGVNPIELGRYASVSYSCCGGFERRTPAPPGMLVFVSQCDAFSCGAFCDHSSHLLALSATDAALAVVRDVTCTEVVSAEPDVQSAAICSRVRVDAEAVTIVTEDRSQRHPRVSREPVDLPKQQP